MGVGPQVSTITVTTAGTRTQIVSATTYVVAVYIEALKTNTGVMYVGDSAVSSTKYSSALAAGAGFGIAIQGYGRVSSSGGGPELQLNSLYLDASVSGEKVNVTYFTRVGPL